ncbi:hypothetical protein BC829DRAFT_380814 [Chytridium lagenaria]|nr:hypothetical protein BC829DRAFT_380814 [Chytridium lagenaria]
MRRAFMLATASLIPEDIMAEKPISGGTFNRLVIKVKKAFRRHSISGVEPTHCRTSPSSILFKNSITFDVSPVSCTPSSSVPRSVGHLDTERHLEFSDNLGDNHSLNCTMTKPRPSRIGASSVTTTGCNSLHVTHDLLFIRTQNPHDINFLAHSNIPKSSSFMPRPAKSNELSPEMIRSSNSFAADGGASAISNSTTLIHGNLHSKPSDARLISKKLPLMDAVNALAAERTWKLASSGDFISSRMPSLTDSITERSTLGPNDLQNLKTSPLSQYAAINMLIDERRLFEAEDINNSNDLANNFSGQRPRVASGTPDHGYQFVAQRRLAKSAGIKLPTPLINVVTTTPDELVSSLCDDFMFMNTDEFRRQNSSAILAKGGP